MENKDMALLYHSLEDAVCQIYGENCSIESRQYVSGGDINEAYALGLNNGSMLFIKRNGYHALENFEAEAAGLSAIRNTGVIGVPEVLGLGVDGEHSFLLLEYISGGPRIRNYWESFAAELARMHKAEVSGTYGFGKDNFIGSRKQVNKPHDTWVSFFRDCRLRPQLTAAEPYFSADDRRRAQSLLEHLDCFLVEPESPALVHGDLWAGNMITGNDGKGWLIDPAVYYGHPEVDIAMTELFGGFAPEFYEAYKETGCLGAGYEDRRDVYNLYHFLNHLNMFGGGYLSSVLAVIRRYG